RHIFRNPKRAAQIHLPFNIDSDVLKRNSHCRRNKLASELSTSRQRAEQEITRARRGAWSTDTGVRLCLKQPLTNLHRAGDRRITLIAVRLQSDTRTARIAAVLFLQRLLN